MCPWNLRILSLISDLYIIFLVSASCDQRTLQGSHWTVVREEPWLGRSSDPILKLSLGPVNWAAQVLDQPVHRWQGGKQCTKISYLSKAVRTREYKLSSTQETCVFQNSGDRTQCQSPDWAIPFGGVFSWIVLTPALSYCIFIGSCCSAFWCPAFLLWWLQRHWSDINPHWPIQLSDLFKEPLFQFENLEFLSSVCVCRKHTSAHSRIPNPYQGEMGLEGPSSVKPRPWYKCIRLQFSTWLSSHKDWRPEAQGPWKWGLQKKKIHTCSFLDKVLRFICFQAFCFIFNILPTRSRPDNQL